MSSDKFLPKIPLTAITTTASKKYLQDQAAGLVPFQITQNVSVTAGATITLGTPVDAGSIIDLVILRPTANLAGQTGVNVGIGDGSDPDRFGNPAISTLTAGATVFATGVTTANGNYTAGGNIVLTATDGSGSASGTFTAAGLNVVVIGRRFVGFEA